jgi:Ca2+-binding EF-hand superfamily protein
MFYWILITRHLCYCFDVKPHLRPAITPGSDHDDVEFTSEQLVKVREIFTIFDLDCSGTMDQRELDVAMVALGLHLGRPKDAPKREMWEQKRRNSLARRQSIIADGRVTLEGFTVLMTAEMNHTDPMDAPRAAFAALSCPDGDIRNDDLITLGKLQAACKTLEVLGSADSAPNRCF